MQILTCCRNLDLSFNHLRHIPAELTLPSIKELYFVNNKINAISTGVRHLTTLTLLELGSNRIRVCRKARESCVEEKLI